jgi:CRP/FNR family transcriptional regulator, dissimilatory nitrate respiration regulator
MTAFLLSTMSASMRDETLLDIMKCIPLFSELDIDDLMLLMKSCSLRQVKKGSILFEEGTPYRGMYVVIEGAVKVYRLSPDGKETMLHLLFPTQTLAEIPMFAGSDYPAHAETLEDGSLCFVEKEGFLNLLRRDTPLALKMLAGLSKRLRTLATQLEELTAHDVRTRLLNYIAEEFGRQKHSPELLRLRLPVTKSVLASTLGMSLETLSRTFRKLEDEGLIQVKGRIIHVRDVRAITGRRSNAST